eukprot:CAMPEP_0184690150 /NCGR_PEP_ID=MMETSP0312-20130426/31059_1 /TAXON_ID=31354 /ORGANISM="Compsopogon coeruleus, Strain SAG 36.94" /LENGTH=577 /DNA_ID=CAMNT_0027147595 /DNA_START=796 /DNA_END=2529 /DNA_ORIENTATION=+
MEHLVEPKLSCASVDASECLSFCNPINIEYRFAPPGKSETCFREAADPSVINFHGTFYLFPSVSGGYYYSVDLVSWSFIPSKVLPTEDYAPDVRLFKDGFIYFTASRHPPDHCPIFRSKNPEHGDSWELVSQPMPYWDPNLFEDTETGRVFLYHGCTNKRPLRGIELNPATMLPIDDPLVEHDLIFGNPKQHGWERLAENNEDVVNPYIEGAWMDLYQKKYYLQYASPSTLINVYSDAVYESTTSPLGPFHCALHNPFSFKPGGFMTGAGHGSTFQDQYGNWWHSSTMRITVHHIFERRVGIWPAGFDSDGVLFCNTRFGDYPIQVPRTRWNDVWIETTPRWMLLSYKKSVEASASLDGHPPSLSVDENCRTWWSAPDRKEGHWLKLDLDRLVNIHACQLNFAEQDCDQYLREGEALFHRYTMEVSSDETSWTTAIDKSQSNLDRPHDFQEFVPEIRSVRFCRFSFHHIAGGGKPAISGVRIFGCSGEDKPVKPLIISSERDVEDPCIVSLSWTPCPGASGYNVLWGIDPGKLYSSWMVLEVTSLTLRCLNANLTYYFAVEAFNAGGISPRSPTVMK